MRRRASSSPSPRRAPSCLLGASTALPRTAPFVPAVHAIVMNSSDLASGWMTRPNQGPRLNPTGNSPHGSSRAFVDPERREPIAHPLAGVGQVVRAGQPRADPVTKHVEMIHHLGLFVSRGDDPIDLHTLAFGGVLVRRPGQEWNRQDRHDGPPSPEMPSHAQPPFGNDWEPDSIPMTDQVGRDPGRMKGYCLRSRRSRPACRFSVTVQKSWIVLRQ